MADHDPISGSSTPSKRRKLNDGKAWDSQDDSGEEFTVEDFNTVATMPITQQRNQLQYSKEQFHSDLRTNDQATARTYITQPTQTMRISSPPPLPHTSDVLVDRSSPIASPPPKAPPQPMKRALSKPTILASAMAPPGTSFRAPLGIQNKPAPVQIDSDSDDDPPIHHSSDEGETQGLRSTLKPTNFRQGGRDLDSTNRNVVKESPRPPSTNIATFTDFVSQFGHNSPSNNNRGVDDMSSAYGSSRRPKSDQVAPARVPPKQNVVAFNTIDDIPNYVLQKKVLSIQAVLPQESVQRCIDALKRKNNNVDDAMDWLTADEERDASGEDDDELASSSPAVKRGVAIKTARVQSQSSQPVRSAKQEITAPTVRIADKYGTFQATRRESQADSPVEEAPSRPKGRLLQRGRNSARHSPEPPSSPPTEQQKPQRHRKQPIVVSDDEGSDLDSEIDRAVSEHVQSGLSPHEQRLLRFFNECSVQDLADLSAQPEAKAQFLIDNRPFQSLEHIRGITDVNQTKSGRQSKARSIGDKMVELCDEMLAGYNAVDTLVERCESLAKPIHATLKEWGAGTTVNDGEVDLMHVDHDSGIGTPTSSTHSEVPTATTRRRFLNQPASMSTNVADTLKDYQLVGLNWLNLLWSQKLSCILADEMGLGKTCQVIAFLAHLQEMEVNGVHLIVVPSSTIENWLRELRRFAPKLNVIAYYGTQDERLAVQERVEAEFNNIDVVVTTINMAVSENDNKFLRKQIDPLVCVFDEAHALRNRNSERYRQLSRIPATFRILLTGTPLQNNLQELMSILAFMMPEMFHEHREDLEFIFKYKATTKDIDTSNAALLSSQRIARARSMMTPFILRRKKDQVLDLPPKHNYVEYCDMTASQANYYNSLLQEFQTYLEVDAAAKARKTKRPVSSNMLMSLRKAAIHPLLARRLYNDEKIDKIVAELLKHREFAENKPQKIKEYLTGDHYQSFKGGDFGLHRFCQERDYLHKYTLKKREWASSSGKVEKFEELVKQFAVNGDRILVFSQFTTMMDILEHVLEKLSIRFMRLDGSTDVQIRQDMLDKFAEDTSIPVFMLSTKAGGAGINLACANKVIIFDSGFNPQDDIQAENRAHRIGQTKDVDVYRLVTRDTIEVQIAAVNDLKIALGEQVADEGSSEKQAEKANEKLVAEMFVESLKKEEGTARDSKVDTAPATIDIRDAFKCGLESAGVRVSSKQAQF